MRRISALTALVFLLTCWALPADATPRRLRLVQRTVESVVQPAEPGRAVRCDGANFFDCGYIAVTVTLAGLEGRGAPSPNEGPRLLGAGGTASISRSYGCRTPTGWRSRDYDVTVRQNVILNTRRGQPVLLPDAGDTVTVRVFAFLFDAQPRNCPVGTEPVMYRLATTRIRFNLESRLDTVPYATYRILGRSSWRGAVPTPPAAG